MKNMGLTAVIILGALAYNAFTSADRDGSGAIVGEGSVDAFDLRVGDCFDLGGAIPEDGSEVDSLPGVPCADPHDNEVYATFDLTVSEIPDEEELWMMSFDGCEARFADFVGMDYESSSLDIRTLYPTPESWDQRGDREVICALFDMNDQKLVGSARGRGI